MASDDPTAAAGGPKIKLLCSSGGRILPRPSDNSLRYVGGDTRIVSLRRHQPLSEILRKLSETPSLLRYQLPDEELDALISVSTQEDLDNMFDEYDKLVARDPSAKLRVFIFPANDAGIGNSLDCYFGTNDLQDVSAKYLEAVNGVERKDSVASFSSNGEDGAVGHSVVSPTCGGDNVRSSFTVKNDAELLNFCSYSDQGDLIGGSQSANYLPQVFVDPHPVQFINPHHQPYVMLGVPPPLVNVVGMPTTQQANVAISQSMQVSGGAMQQATHMEGSNNGTKMPRPPSDPKLQPLSQLPPLPPPHLLAPSGARQGQSVLKGQGVTGMPHVYSDPLFNESASGNRGSVFEAKPVLQSHHSDNNMMRNRGTQLMTSGGVVDAHQLENLVSVPSLESYGFKEASLDVLGGNERLAVLNAESLSPHSVASTVDNYEQAKLFSQPGSVLLPSKHLISPSLSHPDESVQEHIQLMETIALAKNPVKQDTITDAVASGVVFGESSASQQSQFIHENFPIPANSNVYARPTVSMCDSLFSSPTETSVFSQPLAAVVSPENGTAIELKPKTSQLVDNNQNFKPQSQASVLPIYTPVVPSGSILEQNASPPAEPLLPTTSNYVYVQNIHPSNMSYMPHVAGSNVYSYLDAVVGTTGLPSYAYDNTTHGMSLVGGTKVMDPNFQINEAFGNPKIPASGNPQINPARNAAYQEKLQESTTSNSLFFNDDPQKILGSSSELPARSNISNKESVFLKDVHPENISTDKKGLDAGLSEGNLTSPSPDSLNKDLVVETAWLQGSEQEHVEQDMRVSAEGKKAPGPSLSKPPRAVLNTSESKGSSTVNGENESNVKIDDGKNENIKAKHSDKASYSFPNVDDLGNHLQVIRNDDLEELLELGSGTFGTVYHGKWRGTDVAIKRLNDRVFSGKQSEQERARLDFLNEASKLASLHHPNVVAFYGIVLDGPGGVVATVTEYMVNGSLRNALQNNDRIRDRRPRLIIAMDVAFGMEYLHSRDIIHFDLKSDNLLVNLRDPQRPICKVGDLGLSKLKFETLMSGGMRGTLPWMAPEILGGKKHTEKVDVFSFGIVMWELLTGEEPYADLHYGAIIGGIINNSLRPSVPESCDAEWRSLMEQCWSNDPSERPSFTEIAGKLRQMAASLPQKK